MNTAGIFHSQPAYSGQDDVRTHFAERGDAVDRDASGVREGLRELGSRGLLALGAPGNRDGQLGLMAQVIEDVAAGCLSSGFSVWAQRMVIEYLSHSSSCAEHASALSAGTAYGATAMAPALRDIAGIAPVPVVATPDRDGLALNGTIPWSSNLFPQALVVLPARLEDETRVVVSLKTSDPGVHIGHSPELLALNATASGSITLTDATVAHESVLSTHLEEFVHAVRPAFLLLQTAFCAGLAGRALTESECRLDGLNAEFAGQWSILTDDHAGLRDRLLALAGKPDEASYRDLLQLRLDAVTVTTSATRLEATVRGGPGYLTRSATARRLREAAFLPIQAPTEGQLRWELSRCE